MRLDLAKMKIRRKIPLVRPFQAGLLCHSLLTTQKVGRSGGKRGGVVEDLVDMSENVDLMPVLPFESLYGDLAY